MVADQSMWHFFANAGPVVKAVMLLLLLASVLSWTIIFQRAWFFKRAEQAVIGFEDKFWSGVELTKLYQDLKQRAQEEGGLASLFKAGFNEYIRLSKQPNIAPETVIDGVQRAMRIRASREMAKLESHLNFLATVGSTSPYIGLFGTVWGIMTSFHALGSVQQATIAMVAPGISEALIATAMGLFAAIPAVIAYNRYAAQVEKLQQQYDTFQDEMSTIIHRQVYAGGEV